MWKYRITFYMHLQKSKKKRADQFMLINCIKKRKGYFTISHSEVHNKYKNASASVV